MPLPDSLRTAAVAALPVVVAVAVAAGATALHLERRHRASGDAGAAAEGLEAARRAQAAGEEQRLERLRLAVERLAADPDLSAAIVRGEAPPDDLLAGFLARHDLDRVVVGDAAGGVLAAARIGPGSRAGGDAPAEDLLAAPVAATALEEGAAAAPIAGDGALFATAAARVVREFDLLGVVAAAETVDAAWSEGVARPARAAVAYVLAGPGGPVLAATSLDPAAAGALVPALERRDALAPALSRDGGGALPEATPPFEPIDLVGRHFLARVERYPRSPGVARVTLLPDAAAGAPWRRAAWVALAAGLAGLAAALLVLPWPLRRLRAPLHGVEEAAAAARDGDLDDVVRDPALPPAAAALFADLHERRALAATVEAAIEEAARSSPGGAAGRAAGAAREGTGDDDAARPAWLLGVELPGYARAATTGSPAEALERFGRDVERVRRAVAARGGRLAGVLGHRLLAVLPDDPEREAPAGDAMTAAAEILATLARPEDAFDAPQPPVVALATGRVVAPGDPDGAAADSGADGRRLGLAVQQVESLLREGASGDLVLSREAAGRLAGRFAAAGVERTEQRGVISPRPLVVLDERRAAALADAEPPDAPEAPAGADPRQRFGHGTLLGGRFVLVRRLVDGEETAGDLAAVRFRGRDRETAREVIVTALDRRLLADRLIEQGPDRRLDRRLEPYAAADPALAPLVGWGEEEGVVYLAHDAAGPGVAETTLDRLIDRRLPPAAAMRCARALAAGLAALHREGLAHGAVEPRQVRASATGAARLGGAGLAVLLPAPGEGPASALLPPPRFLAPERRAGGPPSPAADVYGATAVLAAALVGGAPTVETAGWPAGLPPALGALLDRGLAAAPDERPPDGDALFEALAEIGPWTGG